MYGFLGGDRNRSLDRPEPGIAGRSKRNGRTFIVVVVALDTLDRIENMRIACFANFSSSGELVACIISGYPLRDERYEPECGSGEIRITDTENNRKNYGAVTAAAIAGIDHLVLTTRLLYTQGTDRETSLVHGLTVVATICTHHMQGDVSRRIYVPPQVGTLCVFFFVTFIFSSRLARRDRGPDNARIVFPNVSEPDGPHDKSRVGVRVRYRRSECGHTNPSQGSLLHRSACTTYITFGVVYVGT